MLRKEQDQVNCDLQELRSLAFTDVFILQDFLCGVNHVTQIILLQLRRTTIIQVVQFCCTSIETVSALEPEVISFCWKAFWNAAPFREHFMLQSAANIGPQPS